MAKTRSQIEAEKQKQSLPREANAAGKDQDDQEIDDAFDEEIDQTAQETEVQVHDEAVTEKTDHEEEKIDQEEEKTDQHKEDGIKRSLTHNRRR